MYNETTEQLPVQSCTVEPVQQAPSRSAACSASYLGIDGLVARIFLVHLEVELGGGDGQGSSEHRRRSHQLSAGAEVHRACGDTQAG